ncbi:MAG: ribulose-phosphate 3-epimerase [Firmicutes bacterium]|nr:ribulose-phosphate 3-epimerase [Bacillota bacterium]MCL2256123.1 ribulose-phosphate 3-epimerase [Bacillota bacterium]
MKNILIAPSILSADFSKMGEEISRMQMSGSDIIHCDVMDGLFVPNITFGPKMIADIRKITTLPLDVHLMIEKPERYVEHFIKAGADYLTIHHEATKELVPTLKRIKECGVKSGAVISPDTEVNVLKGVLQYCDMVVLMSVYPGFGGQKFIEKSIQRLNELSELARNENPSILIEVDGGVTKENAKQITNAGATVLVAGNTVFSSSDPRDTIKQLKS